jgi:iron(III) transport system ATP-binding protein
MIHISNLHKYFHVKEGAVAALKNINLTIAEKEFFVLLGPSGSGKSTLLRCIAGIEDPDSGSMSLGDRVIYSGADNIKLPPEARGLGMVFQSYAVWPHLTVYENVALPLRFGANKVEGKRLDERVMDALKLVQLENLAQRPVPFLSGGQQQRVALARALAIKPKVLLMDEPLSNLDARLREEVRQQIRTATREVGVTVVYVTHDREEALALADKIAVMHLGQIMQIGDPYEVFHQPTNPIVADFFGEMNWLEGSSAKAGVVSTPLGDIRVQSSSVGALKIGLRPCNLVVTEAATGGANEFTGKIVDEIFLGEQVQLLVETTGGLRLEAKQSKRGRDRWLGRTVWCHVDPQDVFVYAADQAALAMQAA